METMQDFAASISTAFNETLSLIAEMLPKLVIAVVIIIVGWLLARLLRALTRRLLAALEKVLQRASEAASLEYKSIRSSTVLIFTNLIFWIVILASIGVAVQILEFDLLAHWFAAILDYIPALAAGVVIIIGGVIVGGAVYRLLLQTSADSQSRQVMLLARAAQIVVIASASLIGVATLGIDVTLLANAVTVAIAAALGSVALAMALGLPKHISNLIAAREARRRYHVGDIVRIDGYEGRIVEISSSHVIVDAQDGEVAIPGNLFAEQSCTRLPVPSEHDGS